jgi:hypothetical protein
MGKVIIKQVIHNHNNTVLFEFKPDENLINTLKQQIQHFNWNKELQTWTTLYYPSLKKELFSTTTWQILVGLHRNENENTY